MELIRTDVVSSPIEPGRVRLTGTVRYDDATLSPEQYWFDVPEAHADGLSTSANPWLAAMLPLATKLGEPIRLALPLDRTLWSNAHELMTIWRCWYPELHVVPIEAELTDGVGQHNVQTRTAAFFSGGVDSLFTALRHAAETKPEDRSPLTLLMVAGFDVPVAKLDALSRMRTSLANAAAALNVPFVDVWTNLKETRFRNADWLTHSFGAMLAAVGLALERQFTELLIASVGDPYNLEPNASHPLTDPLFSTSTTQVIHDGAAYSRVAKTEYIARSEVALRTLRVCWKHRLETNCCDCVKCYRTMLTLHALDVLEKCTTFSKGIDWEKAERMYAPGLWDQLYCKQIEERARLANHQDVVDALQKSYKYSKALDRRVRLVNAIKRRPYCRRMGRLLEVLWVSPRFERSIT